MATKAIREFDGKHLLQHWLGRSPSVASWAVEASVAAQAQVAQVTVEPGSAAQVASQLEHQFMVLEQTHRWLHTTSLVAKPDQLLKRRGKGGLLLLNANWDAVKAWIGE